MSDELRDSVFTVVEELSMRLLDARKSKRNADGDRIFALVEAIRAEFPEEYHWWHTAWMRRAPGEDDALKNRPEGRCG